MTYSDYYRVQEEVDPDTATLREWLRKDMTSPPAVLTSELDGVLRAPMWAERDAESAVGDHPLVLWSYRDSVPTSQVLLNEFLASHGYVVAFAWPIDRLPPVPWQEGLSALGRQRALDVQVHLLERVLDRLSQRAWIRSTSTSVLSWSYGGESANRLQRQRSEVGLVIGIDSTVVSGWIFESRDALEQLDPRGLDVPYVLLRHDRPRIGGDETPPPPLLAKIPAGGWIVRFPGLSHGNFNFTGGMLPGVLGLADVSDWAVGGDPARVGYEEICRTVLAFLEMRRRGAESPDLEGLRSPPDRAVEMRRYPPHR